MGFSSQPRKNSGKNRSTIATEKPGAPFLNVRARDFRELPLSIKNIIC